MSSEEKDKLYGFVDSWLDFPDDIEQSNSGVEGDEMANECEGSEKKKIAVPYSQVQGVAKIDLPETLEPFTNDSCSQRDKLNGIDGGQYLDVYSSLISRSSDAIPETSPSSNDLDIPCGICRCVWHYTASFTAEEDPPISPAREIGPKNQTDGAILELSNENSTEVAMQPQSQSNPEKQTDDPILNIMNEDPTEVAMQPQIYLPITERTTGHEFNCPISEGRPKDAPLISLSKTEIPLQDLWVPDGTIDHEANCVGTDDLDVSLTGLDNLKQFHQSTPNIKKRKRKSFGRDISSVEDRQCTHCGTRDTPQWRSGPKGGKTLCNACGVRYTSGRLLPEYRPRKSPTFDELEHSNAHRKVLRLRRKNYPDGPEDEELEHGEWVGMDLEGLFSMRSFDMSL